MTTRSLLFRLALLIFACLPLAGAAQDAPVDSGATQPLIDTLEDPEARQRLIDALSAEVAQTAPQGEEVVEKTLAAQAAEYTQTLISDIATGTVRVFQDFGRFSLLPDLLTPERLATIQAEMAASFYNPRDRWRLPCDAGCVASVADVIALGRNRLWRSAARVFQSDILALCLCLCGSGFWDRACHVFWERDAASKHLALHKCLCDLWDGFACLGHVCQPRSTRPDLCSPAKAG